MRNARLLCELGSRRCGERERARKLGRGVRAGEVRAKRADYECKPRLRGLLWQLRARRDAHGVTRTRHPRRRLR